MIQTADIRTIKKALADTLATVPGIGEIIPAKMVFPSKAAYWAAVNALTTQKAIETQSAAFCMVGLSVPRVPVDEFNEKVFNMVFEIRAFREAFDTRVDESTTPDAFNKKLFASEDTFDAAMVNLGYVFREEITIGGLGAGLTATILPVEADGGIEFGEPDFFPGVFGNYLGMTINVEVVFDDCE